MNESLESLIHSVVTIQTLYSTPYLEYNGSGSR